MSVRSQVRGVGWRLTTSVQRIEHRALHVGGVRGAGRLVGVPQRDVAVRRTRGVHLRPRLEGQRRCTDVEPVRIVARRRVLARERREAVGAERVRRRAQRLAAEEDRGEDEQHADARQQRAGEVEAPIATTARRRAAGPSDGPGGLRRAAPSAGTARSSGSTARSRCRRSVSSPASPGAAVARPAPQHRRQVERPVVGIPSNAVARIASIP